MHNQLEDGRPIRLFNVLDDSNCEVLRIEVDFSMRSERIIKWLLSANIIFIFNLYGWLHISLRKLVLMIGATLPKSIDQIMIIHLGVLKLIILLYNHTYEIINITDTVTRMGVDCHHRIEGTTVKLLSSQR